jgi:cytidylate kinase
VVTISASYGAGGSEIGPRVARRLGARFIDRAIPVAVAHELGISVEEAEAVAQNAPSRLWALFAGMATTPDGMAVFGTQSQRTNERELIEQTERQIREVAAEGDCVLLGRAAAIVLADHPGALHVRLRGAVEGRIEAAMHQHGIDRDTATAAQKENDKIRSGYVKHFYRSDSANPAQYHLVLDTVRLGWSRAEDLVVEAVRLMEQPG